MKPQILDKIIHPDGREEVIAPEELRQLLSRNIQENRPYVECSCPGTASSQCPVIL
jgi:hypothetical protein